MTRRLSHLLLSRSSSRSLLVACWTLSIVLTSPKVGAQSNSNVRYSAPTECPSEDDFEHQLEHWIARASWPQATIHVEQVEETFALRMLLVLGDGEERSREIRGSSCSSLVQAGALALAIAADPELLNRLPNPSSGEEVNAPVSSEPSARNQAISLARSLGQPNPPEASFTTRPETDSHPPSVGDETTLPIGPPPAPQTAFTGYLAAFGILEGGALPDFGFGAALRGGLRFYLGRPDDQSWLLEPNLHVLYLPERIQRLSFDNSIGGRFYQMGGGLGLNLISSWTLSLNWRVETGLGLALRASTIDAQGFGVTTPSHQNRLSWAVETRILGRLREKFWIFELGLGPVVVPTANDYFFPSIGVVHQAQILSWQLDLGLGVNL